MKVKLPIVAAQYEDHITSASEKRFKTLQENPLRPVLNTVYGVKTYEDENIMTISSETSDFERDQKTDFRFGSHMTIVKSCLIKFEKLGQIELEVEDDEAG